MQWTWNCRKCHGAHKDWHFLIQAAMKRKYKYYIYTNCTTRGQLLFTLLQKATCFESSLISSS